MGRKPEDDVSETKENEKKPREGAFGLGSTPGASGMLRILESTPLLFIPSHVPPASSSKAAKMLPLCHCGTPVGRAKASSRLFAKSSLY